MSYRLQPLEVKPPLKLSVAFDVMDTIYASFKSQSIIDAIGLELKLSNYPPQTVKDVLSELQDAKIIHISQTDQRLLPTTPSDNYNSLDIVKVILGDEPLDSPGGQKSMQIIHAAEGQS